MNAPTLAQAKGSYFAAAQKQGAVCPCCDRFGKVYKRKFHSSMSAVLILLYRHAVSSKVTTDVANRGFIHTPTLINAATNPGVAAAIRGDFAKMRYWGLIEEGKTAAPTDKKYSGSWRITGEGARFVEGSTKIREYVWIYNTKALGFDGESISIQDSLGSRFSYRELMGT